MTQQKGHERKGGSPLIVVLAVVYTKELRTSKLFAPALHALTKMGIDWWDNRVYSCIDRRRAQERAIGLLVTP
jgi:hypothetical protein